MVRWPILEEMVDEARAEDKKHLARGYETLKKFSEKHLLTVVEAGHLPDKRRVYIKVRSPYNDQIWTFFVYVK